MWPLYVVEDMLRQQEVILPECAMGQAMIYTANAWSVDGEGLFDPAPDRNLSIALDFAITQSLLLPASETIRISAALHTRLNGLLTNRFPCSEAFLRALQSEQVVEATYHDQTPRDELVAAKNPALCYIG